MKINWRVLVSVFFVIVLLAIQVAYWIDPLTLSDLLTIRDSIFNTINRFPIVSAVVYIVCYTASIVFGIPVSITVIGGYFLGYAQAIVYSVLGIASGTFILCVFVRYVAHDIIQKRYAEQIKPLKKEIDTYGVYYIAFVHAIPFFPSFAPHVAAAVSSIPLYQIVLANVVGALPLTVMYAVAGAVLPRLDSFKSFIMYVSILGSIFMVPLLGYLVYKRWYKLI